MSTLDMLNGYFCYQQNLDKR